MNGKFSRSISSLPQAASSPAVSEVALEIGELRLIGFEPHGRGELHDLIVHEITAFMVANPVPWRGDINIERLDLGRVKPGSTRSATAKSIASRICCELQRPEYQGEEDFERLADRSESSTGKADRT